jgi:cell division transport system permease protein
MTSSAQRQNKPRFSLRVYFSHHKHAWKHGLRQLSKNPLASILTIAVISITLLLPTGLLTVLTNLQQATHDWNKGTTLSIYMTPDATSAQFSYVQQALSNVSNVGNIKYISPDQGLAQFSKQSGLTNVIQSLDSNPLPGVFKITPINQATPAVNLLRSQLLALPNITDVKIDMLWVKRLNAIIKLLQQFTYGLAIVLALAVLLIIGNTIRMNIQTYHQEIEVMKLVGASNRFIRRPFLYSGLLYGLSAAIFCAVTLDFFMLWLQGPLNKLTELYSTQFALDGLSISQTLLLIMAGCLLGYIGSWLVVDKYLRRISPH